MSEIVEGPVLHSPAMKHLKPRSRISCVGFSQHQVLSQPRQPFTGKTEFDRLVDSDEEPYIRPGKKVGMNWTPIDLGHLEDYGGAGLIELENAGPHFTVVPTPEERADAYSPVIEVGVEAGGVVIKFARVRPGEKSFRIEPCDGERYFMRCIKGEARVTITAYPK